MNVRVSIIVASSAGLLLAAACSKSSPASPTAAPAAAAVDASLTGSVTTPRPLAPAAGAAIPNLSQPVTLTVQNAIVTKAGGTTYTFEVATDAAFTAKVQTKDAVAEGSGGQTSVKLDALARREGLLLACARHRRRHHRRVRRHVQVHDRAGDCDQRAGADRADQRGGDRARVRRCAPPTRPAPGPPAPISYRFEISSSSAFSSILVTGTNSEGVNETGFIPTVGPADQRHAVLASDGHRSGERHFESGIGSAEFRHLAHHRSDQGRLSAWSRTCPPGRRPGKLSWWSRTAAPPPAGRCASRLRIPVGPTPSGSTAGPIRTSASTATSGTSPTSTAPGTAVPANGSIAARPPARPGRARTPFGPDSGFGNPFASWVPKVGELVGYAGVRVGARAAADEHRAGAHRCGPGPLERQLHSAFQRAGDSIQAMRRAFQENETMRSCVAVEGCSRWRGVASAQTPAARRRRSRIRRGRHPVGVRQRDEPVLWGGVRVHGEAEPSGVR